jgi:hypothetical protein
VRGGCSGEDVNQAGKGDATVAALSRPLLGLALTPCTRRRAVGPPLGALHTPWSPMVIDDRNRLVSRPPLDDFAFLVWSTNDVVLRRGGWNRKADRQHDREGVLEQGKFRLWCHK